jgi:hypothetical protein
MSTEGQIGRGSDGHRRRGIQKSAGPSQPWPMLEPAVGSGEPPGSYRSVRMFGQMQAQRVSACRTARSFSIRSTRSATRMALSARPTDAGGGCRVARLSRTVGWLGVSTTRRLDILQYEPFSPMTTKSSTESQAARPPCGDSVRLAYPHRWATRPRLDGYAEE